VQLDRRVDDPLPRLGLLLGAAPELVATIHET
jgi:hypothetical protein